MSYETKNIRNIALLGHGNNGKTSLAESMLYVTGAIDRLGKVSDGNTVCDYDAEEIARQITIATPLLRQLRRLQDQRIGLPRLL